MSVPMQRDTGVVAVQAETARRAALHRQLQAAVLLPTDVVVQIERADQLRLHRILLESTRRTFRLALVEQTA